MGMSDSLFFWRSGLSVMIDTCVEIKIYGAFVLNHRVDLLAPDALVDFHTD